MRRPLYTCILISLTSVACGDDAPDPGGPCETDADCTLPHLCGSDGTCRTPAAADDGDPCMHPDHCKSGLCLDIGKGGVCAVACKEPSECAADQVCAPVLANNVPPPGGKPAPELRLLCQDRAGELHLTEGCDADKDCESGLCQDNRCTQPCVDTCPGQLACEQTTLTRGVGTVATGVCEASLLRSIELGPVDVPVAGLTAPVTFDIEKGVDSFLLFADDTDKLHVVITKLEAPDGTVLVDYADRSKELARAYDRTGTATVQVPGTDDAKGAVREGTYKLWLQTYKWDNNVMVKEAGKLERVAVLIRNSPHKGGVLDLNLHFSPGTGITAAKASEEPYVKTTLATLRSLYYPLAGVGLGQVQFFDLPATEDVIKDWDHVATVRETFSKPGPNKLSANIYVVTDIKVNYRALAGGIPGVPGVAGRTGSGVVAEKQFDGVKMGRLLAHELGHYLGLYHTTESEQGPFKHDLIKDTPQCPSGTNIAQCPDYHNLMFPFYYQAPDPLVLSQGQKMVLRGSPFLYELAYPEACGAGIGVVDVTVNGFASGATGLEPASLQSSCGGAGAAERVHLYRLAQSGLKALQIDVVSDAFDPAVYVLKGSCRSGVGSEVGCVTAKQGEVAKLTVDTPDPAPYYIVVDSDAGTGEYRLSVTPVAQ